jgi:hypothetical protein
MRIIEALDRAIGSTISRVEASTDDVIEKLDDAVHWGDLGPTLYYGARRTIGIAAIFYLEEFRRDIRGEGNGIFTRYGETAALTLCATAGTIDEVRRALENKKRPYWEKFTAYRPGRSRT